MISAGGTAKLKLATEEDFKSKSVITADNISKSHGDRTIIAVQPAHPAWRPDRHRRRQWRGQDHAAQDADGRTRTRQRQRRDRQDADRGDDRPAPAALPPTRPCGRCSPRAATGSTCAAIASMCRPGLKDFLFDPKIVDMRVGVLSGERSRLLLAREFAKASNLLVLDEPTNDLDLGDRPAAGGHADEGTVLIVSHDRDFLDRTVTITLASTAAAGSTWSRAAMRRTARPEPVAGSEGRAADKPAPPPPPAPKSNKLYKDQRDYELLPARIEELEAAIAGRPSCPIRNSTPPIRSVSPISPRESRTRGPRRTRPRSDGWRWPNRSRREPREVLRAAIAACRTCAGHPPHGVRPVAANRAVACRPRLISGSMKAASRGTTPAATGCANGPV